MDNINILLVEDSMTQSVMLQNILKQNYYNVTALQNGKEAIEYLQNNKPAIIISDVIMPEMNGYELCRHIKSMDSARDIPVILLTSLSEPEDIIKGLECGANNFITKPYDEKLLLSRIKYILINQELRKSVSTEMKIELYFGGQKHFISSDRMQILDILLATYDHAMEKKRELEEANRELKKALETIKTLKGLIPICAYCKKIRNDGGFWQQLEAYIKEHADVNFSHGICPECVKEHFPGYIKEKK
jgi:two-component system cell cycle response regulator